MITLAENSYGKSSVRVMKVNRTAPLHTLKEWKVEVLLSGAFETCFTVGDNSNILPTDTMKNTVYARAHESKAECVEDFALELAKFFLGRNLQVDRAVIHIASTPWEHVVVNGAPHPSAFVRGTGEMQTTTVTYDQNGAATVTSGFEGLVVLKTAGSAFTGFIRDNLTTLPESTDRLFGTAMRVDWKYHSPRLPFGPLRKKVRDTLLTAFAEHDSKSVQHTLYAMAEAALESTPEIVEMELAMPNKHCLLVDLARFGQSNANEIFVPTDEPYGNIVARICREQ